ncbi:unnamed protein product, partial [Closterium sp. Naga37s-1]
DEGEGGGRGGLVLQIPSPPLLHPQQGDGGEGGGRGGLVLQIPSPPLLLHNPSPARDGGERGGGGGWGAGVELRVQLQGTQAGELQSHARALRVRLQLPPLHDATGHRGRD